MMLKHQNPSLSVGGALCAPPTVVRLYGSGGGGCAFLAMTVVEQVADPPAWKFTVALTVYVPSLEYVWLA